MKAKKNVSMKAMVLMLAVVLLIGCVAGGTMAYLMTRSATVTNTFVAGNIGTLTLDETTGSSYTIIPGKNITKDPNVSYALAAANDVGQVYIFVEISGGNWTYDSANNKFTAEELNWTVADGWTHLSDNVFYMETSAAVTNKPIIADNTIAVASTITKGADIEAAATAATGLSFTAYAIQAEGFNGNVAAAWAQAQTAVN